MFLLQLTRCPFVGNVLAGAEEARAVGLGPVKSTLC